MVFLTMHSSQENARFRLKPGMKLGLLVLERRQERCLDFAWAQEMRARCHAFVKALCRDEGHAMIALNGPDERVADDRTLRASLERARASCDVVVATQPTSADGALAAVLAQHCALPVVFWATPENFEVVGSPFGGISSKSLVGAQDFAAAFRRSGRSDLELVYGGQDWARAVAQLKAALGRAYCRQVLRRAKVGVIGDAPPGETPYDGAAVAKTFAAVVETVSLSELLGRAAGADEATIVEDRTMEHPFANLASEPDDGDRSNRLYVALKSIIETENLDALAVRCGPEIARDYGTWPYVALTRLADEGFPVARDADVDAAVTMLVCKLLGCGAPLLADWLEHDAGSFMAWNAGVAPACLCVAEGGVGAPAPARHFEDKVHGCVDATLEPGMDVTVARFWLLDGVYRVMVCEGKSRPPRRQLAGFSGAVDLDVLDRGGDVFDAFEAWVVDAAMPNKVVLTRGHHKQTLLKFARAHKIVVVA